MQSHQILVAPEDSINIFLLLAPKQKYNTLQLQTNNNLHLRGQSAFYNRLAS